MIKNLNYKKILIFFLLLLNIFILIILINYYINAIRVEIKEKTLINEFWENFDKDSKIEFEKNPDNYIGILEIKSINFQKGFLDINNKNNNVNKNIQVLNNSTMPNTNNSLLVIAGHSGNGQKSYFKNLHKLNINDEINIYYANMKYTYKVSDIYNEEKDGTIELIKNTEPTLILTTCNQKDKTKQLIIEAKLTTAY